MDRHRPTADTDHGLASFPCCGGELRWPDGYRHKADCDFPRTYCPGCGGAVCVCEYLREIVPPPVDGLGVVEAYQLGHKHGRAQAESEAAHLRSPGTPPRAPAEGTDTALIDAVAKHNIVVRQMIGGGFAFEDQDGEWDGKRHPTWRAAALEGLRYEGGAASALADSLALSAEPPRAPAERGAGDALREEWIETLADAASMLYAVNRRVNEADLAQQEEPNGLDSPVFYGALTIAEELDELRAALSASPSSPAPPAVVQGAQATESGGAEAEHVGWHRDEQGQTYRMVREEGGFGRLRAVPVPPWVPSEEETEKALRSLAKAWPVLAQHADYMDGEFDLALTFMRNAIAAFRRALTTPPERTAPHAGTEGDDAREGRDA